MTTSVKFITTFIFSTLFVLILSPRCDAQQEKLTKNGSIRDKNHETLTSPAKVFQMGFFGLEPNQRYLGIWYYADPKTIVWVANRDNPVSSSSSSSFLTIENDGNLVVKDKSRTYFTTGLPSASGSASWTLKLEDTGNLILQDGSGKQMWSSFSFPTDTFLPGMYMEKAMKLTSWKTQNDPGSGSYVFQKDTVFGYNNYTIFYGKRLHWKSGFGLESNINPTKMPIAAIHLLSRSNTTKTLNNSRLVMGSSGEIQFYYWDLTLGKWFLNWSEPKDYCGKYSACGQNSYCDMSKKNEYNSFCNCVPGFDLIPDVVTSEKVCKRTAPICIGNDTNFLKMEIVKIDVTFETFMESKSELECKEKCLGLDCCQAYSYSAVGNEELARVGVPGGKQGCWIWYSGSQLVDLQVSDGAGGRILSIRNPISKGIKPPQIANGKAKRSKPSHQLVIFSAIVVPGVLLLLCCAGFICCRRMNIKKVKGTAESESVHQFNESVRQIQDLLDPLNSNENDSSNIGIPFFDFERITASTDDFSEENKLGEGGFGPVYKGKFPGGLEVAVKRLSINSGQGLEEFKNEVTLIARLQHRNLVRLLGYCMKGNEKLLIYEYMPNNSLDAIIFDGTQSAMLNWPKRFEIIIGICRGLIYLHQDSRLRIIHRDLKTSNVLLDEDLNPKISDFGLAKIVNGKEVESNTKRIIGTYGYMAPEYALEGLFSIKSDVYSFGVVILEIISGKKKHYESDHAISLLNYAWQLWKEDRPLDLMDRVLLESYNSDEVLKCIIVGLLCVQEDPDDRPNMSTVVTMLTSDIATLPEPKQPAFLEAQWAKWAVQTGWVTCQTSSAVKR
ncbi:S-locus glycoprotein domain-containing protein [Artemisia annua]|uniref:Receptor-like serine/threonine-protein kinase n=1 Tax=Artemisia annua TaxID=35608 RepID=A0A2U1PT94_ARTAN|nr:S-locus glycoprotein domain-containing protein [Artemisia annua]